MTSTYDYIHQYKELMKIFPKKYNRDYFIRLKKSLEQHEDAWFESDQYLNYIKNLRAIKILIDTLSKDKE